MPFEFSSSATQKLPVGKRCIEDRRDNPVKDRKTKFRLLQQNMMAYTYSDFLPGFAAPGINSLPFDQLVTRPTENAQKEGRLLFGKEFFLTSPQIAKVEGDVFEYVEGAIHWNTAAWWNKYIRDGTWPSLPRLARPGRRRASAGQVAVLSLPRGYDWVRLLDDDARHEIADLRGTLEKHGLSMPTSTPDMMVVLLPEEFRDDAIFAEPLPNLDHRSQGILSRAYTDLEGSVPAKGILLAIALKKSLRSDRLYQPLYEANVMQLLLERRLGAQRVDLEVHTLVSAGTGAKEIYSAASLAATATDNPKPHRAVRELYEPGNASDVVRRFLGFLDERVTADE